jgi:uncharacterized protein (TIGR00730 family)
MSAILPTRASGNDPVPAIAPLRVDGDRVLLEGPHSRLRELRLVLRSTSDFIRGFRTLHFVGPCVTVFGSARFGETHPAYAVARAVGRGLAEAGFTVMTGGGPGLMEAANRGAREAGGRSVGCAIRLPREQAVNAYLDRVVTCEHFFVRKVLLFKYSYAFIALPGGLGTVDELSEALTLIQTGKILRFPVVLMGTDYWSGLKQQLERMVADGAIDAADLALLFITDAVDDALRHVRDLAIARFGVGEARVRRPARWLGEAAPPRSAAPPP